LDFQTLVLFSLACLALTTTPGPDMLLIAARSVAQGRMAGLFTYLGVATGSFAHALALALGLSHLFLAVPFAYEASDTLGPFSWLTSHGRPLQHVIVFRPKQGCKEALDGCDLSSGVDFKLA
jgi:hypothetical protein